MGRRGLYNKRANKTRLDRCYANRRRHSSSASLQMSQCSPSIIPIHRQTERQTACSAGRGHRAVDSKLNF